jgi:transcriptional regulator GlxA family with amidase domain
VAVATGFVDQAHLHRHFVRTLGITPHRYARAVTGGKNVQDSAAQRVVPHRS